MLFLHAREVAHIDFNLLHFARVDFFSTCTVVLVVGVAGDVSANGIAFFLYSK